MHLAKKRVDKIIDIGLLLLIIDKITIESLIYDSFVRVLYNRFKLTIQVTQKLFP